VEYRKKLKEFLKLKRKEKREEKEMELRNTKKELEV